MMDWRQWFWQRATAHSPLTSLVPVGSMFGAGSLTGTPEKKPFMVIRFESETSLLNDADKPMVTDRTATVWVHDEPGSYARIDDVIGVLKSLFIGDVPLPNTGIVEWAGDSGDLSDDSYRTLTRNVSFRLVGGA